MLIYSWVLVFLPVLGHSSAEICSGKNFPKNWTLPFTKLLETKRIPFKRNQQKLEYRCHLADQVQDFLDHSKKVKGHVLARLYRSDVKVKNISMLAAITINYWNRTMNVQFTRAMKIASHFACAIRSINTDINLLACVFR